MTAPESAAARVAGLVAGPAAPVPEEDLLAGARLRSRLALATVAAAHLQGPATHQAAEDVPTPRRVRWLVPGRLAALAGALLLAGGALAGWRAVQAASPSVLVSIEDAAPTSGAVAGPDEAELVVHVVGAVQAPGVVHVAAGSRVVDAVDAAGGATADADLGAVNLARLLGDGEQVVVPTASTGEGTGSTGVAGDGLVDLNAADQAALDALPGIGPVLAARIVGWRDAHGRFTSVDELAEVTGIGPALLAGLRDLVRV